MCVCVCAATTCLPLRDFHVTLPPHSVVSAQGTLCPVYFIRLSMVCPVHSSLLHSHPRFIQSVTIVLYVLYLPPPPPSLCFPIVCPFIPPSLASSFHSSLYQFPLCILPISSFSVLPSVSQSLIYSFEEEEETRETPETEY